MKSRAVLNIAEGRAQTRGAIQRRHIFHSNFEGTVVQAAFFERSKPIVLSLSVPPRPAVPVEGAVLVVVVVDVVGEEEVSGVWFFCSIAKTRRSGLSFV